MALSRLSGYQTSKAFFPHVYPMISYIFSIRYRRKVIQESPFFKDFFFYGSTAGTLADPREVRECTEYIRRHDNVFWYGMWDGPGRRLITEGFGENHWGNYVVSVLTKTLPAYSHQFGMNKWKKEMMSSYMTGLGVFVAMSRITVYYPRSNRKSGALRSNETNKMEKYLIPDATNHFQSPNRLINTTLH